MIAASESQILQFIAESPSKVSFSCLKRHFYETASCSSKKLKQVIASLIQTGQLCYTSHFGQTFIEISYDQPHAVSEHVIIKPPFCSLKALPGQCVVSLGRGAAFGGGEHPTTRLAIQLMDALLHRPNWQDCRSAWRAIDIGTGSGVLAIVAAKLGVGRVFGIDSDPCAVFEASENVRLNNVEAKIRIGDSDLSVVTGPYDLVFANLRIPTLFDLRSILEKKVAADSALVFSGIKTDEAKPLCDFYKEAGYFIHYNRSEKGWCALCLVRGSFLDEDSGSTECY